MTTRTARSVHTRPATAIPAPARRRRRDRAYQSPNPASTSGISSLVVAARIAVAAKATSRSSSRNQKAQSRSGQASATGWNSFSVSHCTAGRSRYARAKPRAARASSRCLRASLKTGIAPSATAAACTVSSRSGLGQSHQSGANRTRIGSTCAPRRVNCSPWRSVTASGWPCAVAHTAWTMFPRSKRPVSNARWRSIESAANPAV